MFCLKVIRIRDVIFLFLLHLANYMVVHFEVHGACASSDELEALKEKVHARCSYELEAVSPFFSWFPEVNNDLLVSTRF